VRAGIRNGPAFLWPAPHLPANDDEAPASSEGEPSRGPRRAPVSARCLPHGGGGAQRGRGPADRQNHAPPGLRGSSGKLGSWVRTASIAVRISVACAMLNPASGVPSRLCERFPALMRVPHADRPRPGRTLPSTDSDCERGAASSHPCLTCSAFHSIHAGVTSVAAAAPIDVPSGRAFVPPAPRIAAVLIRATSSRAPPSA